MTKHDANSIAAAELADRYIEIMLSTKPDLLMPYQLTSFSEAHEHAKNIAEFRLQLINGLVNQPLPAPEDD